MNGGKRFGIWSRSAAFGAATLAVIGSGAVGTLGFALGGCARAEDQVAAPVVDEWAALQERYKYDASKPLGASVENTQMGFGGRTDTVTILGARGHGVPLYLIVPTSASETNKVPGVVLLHGLGGRIEDMQMVGQYLAMSGFAVVIPEIVAHGQRADDGKPIFDGDVTNIQNNFIESVGDVRRAIDYMTQDPNVDKNRVGLVGLSLGSILGSITQAVEPRIKTSVLLVGGGDWRAILRDSQLPAAAQMREKIMSAPNASKELAVVDPVTFAPHIAPRTVFMINGKKDNVIPEASAKALFSALRGTHNKQMWLPGGHMLVEGDDQNAMLTQVAPPVISWLQRELDPKIIAKRSAETVPAEAPKTEAPKVAAPVAPIAPDVKPTAPAKTAPKTPLKSAVKKPATL